MSDFTGPHLTTADAGRLQRLAAAASAAVRAHPEYRDDVQLLVCIDSEAENPGSCVHGLGYDDEDAATMIANLFMHLRALARLCGKDLTMMSVGEG